MVFGVVIMAAMILAMLQTSALSQATSGRESLARVRAYWAARAGVESVMARLEYDTVNPDLADAYAVLQDMADVSEGDLAGASYRISTWQDKKEVIGPEDASAKININRATKNQLLAIEPFMTEDIADAILDWIDADDDINPLGAEIGYYQGMTYPYAPRNGPMRSIAELELVAGVDARDVRGEDWNLNGVLDPNEDDGDASWPPDNADGVLDRGWSGVLTASSVEGTLAPSGQAMLDLASAQENDLIDRIKVDNAQAKVIIDYIAANPGATMRDFILRDLNQLAQVAASASGQRGRPARVTPLSDAQLGALLEETLVGSTAAGKTPGKLNINTCEATTLEYITEISADVSDAIISERSSRPQGFTTIADLLSVPGMSRQTFANVYQYLTTRSNVYIVTSRGVDTRSGIEVEIRATLDRSSVPVVLQEVTVR